MTQGEILNPNNLTMADVQRLIDERLAQTNAQHEEEMRSMQEQLTAAFASMANRGVVSLIPAHSAGPGLEVADTWSQHEQEISRSGLGLPVVEYIKQLEGVDSGGNILGRFQRLEGDVQEMKVLLRQVADAAHSH